MLQKNPQPLAARNLDVIRISLVKPQSAPLLVSKPNHQLILYDVELDQHSKKNEKRENKCCQVYFDLLSLPLYEIDSQDRKMNDTTQIYYNF